MYRRDFKTGKIDIIYNGVTLNFAEPEILHFRNQDWKKEIKIDFDFEGRHYSADGFVGIMNPGSYEKSGFALFRHNRAINSHYKPSQIFGAQAQTQVSLKLFGELNMDSFDVNQPKDGFSWSAELESEFVKQLKSLIPEYIEVATMSLKLRKAEEEENRKRDAGNAKKSETENIDSSKIHNEIISNSINSVVQNKIETETVKEINNAGNHDGVINFEYKDQSYSVIWSDELDGKFLYNFDKNTCQLKINKNNEYIKSIKDLSLASEISKIILAYVLAEDEAKSSINSNGYIPASVMHNQFDKILSNIR